MRDYGKVYTAFWQSEDMRSATDDARTLALYLMTCPHGNMLGCFRLSDAYAAEDLQWEPERVREGFAELFEKGFAYRCDRTFWVFIRYYLKWNHFENPNVATKAFKLLDSLRMPNKLKGLLLLALRDFGKHFDPSKLDPLDEIIEPFENPFDMSSKTIAVAVAIASASAGALAATEAKVKPVVEQKQPDPVQGIFDYWQKIMKSPGSALDAKRRAVIVKALAKYSPADICKAIRGCSRTPHNMGQNDQKTKYNSIGLILRDADHIDRFILNDAGNAKAAPSSESIEETNRRVMAELLGDVPESDVIEMES